LWSTLADDVPQWDFASSGDSAEDLVNVAQEGDVFCDLKDV
jgi:hypothetical protein